jgi:hypothetical protein
MLIPDIFLGIPQWWITKDQWRAPAFIVTDEGVVSPRLQGVGGRLSSLLPIEERPVTVPRHVHGAVMASVSTVFSQDDTDSGISYD